MVINQSAHSSGLSACWIFCCSCTSVQGRMPLGGVLYRLFVPFWEYSSEPKEKFTFSYRFLYCGKQFRYLILDCMFPIAGACVDFSCRPEIRGVALPPLLYSVHELMARGGQYSICQSLHQQGQKILQLLFQIISIITRK